MQSGDTQEQFELALKYRLEIRQRACRIGSTGCWHVEKGRKILADSTTDRSSLVGAEIDEKMWPEYLHRLPELILEIERQDLACATAWDKCISNSDQNAFQSERAKLIELFGQVHLMDADYGRLVRSPEARAVLESVWLLDVADADVNEVKAAERAFRMTLSEFLDNEERIRVALDSLDVARRKIANTYEQWAMDLAESLHPGSDIAKSAAKDGLFRATAYYDRRRGYEFDTYAIWWVEHRMDRVLKANST